MCLISQPIGVCTSVFPRHINTPGSYRLKTNLTVTCTNKDAIDVTATGLVTIDLNGFSITGPGSGTGVGIRAFSASSSLVVHNGGVAAMGFGIEAIDCKVEEVHLLFNVDFAIDCEDGVILNNTVLNNGGIGIQISDGVVQGNQLIANQFEGITCTLGLVQNNKVTDNGFTGNVPNGSAGIAVSFATVTENNVVDNGGDGIDVGNKSKVGENSVGNNFGDGIGVFGDGDNVIGNTAGDNGGFGIRFPDATSAFTSNVVNGNGDLPVCGIATTCNSEVCGGTSMDTGLTNLCNGVKG